MQDGPEIQMLTDMTKETIDEYNELVQWTGQPSESLSENINTDEILQLLIHANHRLLVGIRHLKNVQTKAAQDPEIILQQILHSPYEDWTWGIGIFYVHETLQRHETVVIKYDPTLKFTSYQHNGHKIFKYSKEAELRASADDVQENWLNDNISIYTWNAKEGLQSALKYIFCGADGWILKRIFRYDICETSGISGEDTGMTIWKKQN
jgi:hypothetical protein